MTFCKRVSLLLLYPCQSRIPNVNKLGADQALWMVFLVVCFQFLFVCLFVCVCACTEQEGKSCNKFHASQFFEAFFLLLF